MKYLSRIFSRSTTSKEAAKKSSDIDKTTLRSYISTDMKSIFSNPSAILVLAVLAILPSFYAWFNILSSWDPYGNTSHIKVAVASEDKGVLQFEKNINIGENVLKNLKENTKMGWVFVDAKDAAEGVRRGDYYASIVFPENFSKDMVSFLDSDPRKPKIIYTVNEKTNAIVPKITQKGVEGIEAQIESSVLGAMNKAIFERANKRGDNLSSLKQNIHKSRELLAKITPKMNELHADIEKVQAASKKGIVASTKIRSSLPGLEESLNSIVNIAGSAQRIEESISGILDGIPDFVDIQITLLRKILADGIELAKMVTDLSYNIADISIEKIEKIQGRLGVAKGVAESMSGLRKFLNAFSPNNTAFAPFIDANNRLLQNIDKYNSLLEEAKGVLQAGGTIDNDKLNKLKSIADAINAYALKIQNLSDGELKNKLISIREELSRTLSSVATKSKKLQGEIPRMKTFLGSVEGAVQKGDQVTGKILDNRGKIEKGVNKMQELSVVLSDKKIDALLHLLSLNPLKEKGFFERLIEVDDTHLFPIPTYGSAISPFFTVLALWVGGLLAVSLLSVHPTLAVDEEDYRWGYLTRLLLFVSIGVMQAVILSLGNIHLLEVYAVEPRLMVILCMIIAVVFQTIIFSLVYLLGNIGKVMGILLLVVQLSASGGTFPVELTKSFFVQIHPYLPFTYAINAVRESVGGVVPEILMNNVQIVAYIGIGMFLFAFFAAPYLAKRAIKFNERTQGVDAFH